MERLRKARDQLRLEVGVQGAILLHRPDFGAGLEQGGRQRAEPRADLDHRVTRLHGSEFERFVDDVAIDEEILAEKPLRLMAELGKQFARGGR